MVTVPRKPGNPKLATAIVVEPWGVRIILTEGLTPEAASRRASRDSRVGRRLHFTELRRADAGLGR